LYEGLQSSAGTATATAATTAMARAERILIYNKRKDVGKEETSTQFRGRPFIYV